MKLTPGKVIEKTAISDRTGVIVAAAMDQQRLVETAHSRMAARLESFDEFDVFLAHNSQDRLIIEEIAISLRRRRLNIWFDQWILPPGRLFQEEIEKVLPHVKAIAVFVGTSGLGTWERMEMRSAISYFVEWERPVIPVLLPGASQLPVFLREFSPVSFEAPGDRDALKKLVWGITGKNPLKRVRRKK